MKKMFSFILLVIGLIMLVGCQKNLPVIGVIQIVTHDSLDKIRDACIEELANEGYIDNETCKIVYANANNETSALSEIMASMKNKNCDVVVAITTPVAVSSLAIVDEIPVVFAAVSDPSSVISASNNITGTSDAIQVDLVLDYAIEMGTLNNNKVSKIGFIYNPSEANSVSNLSKIEKYLEDKDIQLIAKTIEKAADMQIVAETLATQVDMIFVTDDNTVASVMPTLAEVCNNSKVPVYVGADSMVNDGGLATIGINYYDLGIETGKMVVKVLNGTKPADIAVKVFNENLKLYVNRKTLNTLGYSLKDYAGEVVYLGD